VKLLLDACVWGGAKGEIAQAGHDVVWVGDWDSNPEDDEVLAFAHQEGRSVITIDKDFGELAIVYRQPHHGILRLVGFSGRQHGRISLDVIEHHGAELAAGALIVAEPGRLRIRPPESDED
jgi:predicted nuclease of predicted toxin-antitoxin system